MCDAMPLIAPDDMAFLEKQLERMNASVAASEAQAAAVAATR